jgi:3-oxoacyl-(acyl-carrier-protein) synthase
MSRNVALGGFEDGLGESFKELALSSTKSMVGHASRPAGSLEAVASLVAVHKSIAPPTTNYLGADPACDPDCVPNEARDMSIDIALSNSFAFGGLNAVLASTVWR